MKKKPLIVVVFLMMLCISPLIVSGYYGEVSPQSITSFDETLPDNVLFYPDGDFQSLVHASSGSATPTESGTYTDTLALDASYYRASSSGSPFDAYLELNFTMPSINLGPIIYLNTYGKIDFQYPAAYTDNSLYVWDENTTAFVDVGNFIVDNTLGWINVTIDSGYVVDGMIFFYYVAEDTDGESYIYIDYAEVIVMSPIVLSANSFAESFSEVADWETPTTGATGATITSDGDVATITENGPASLGIAYASFDTINYYEYYYEFSIVSMTATTAALMFWDSGVLLDYISLKTFTSSGTYKGIISNIDTESMQRIGFVIDSNNGDMVVDSLRISLSNESGWQHDGSTTEGTTTNGLTSSDGDILNFTADDNIDWMYVKFDTTTISAVSDASYYPFIKFSITSATAIYRVDVIGTTTSSTIKDYSTDTGIFGFNIKAIESTIGNFDYLRVYISTSGTNVLFDYIKIYSIVNFTVTQSEAGTDDYLYVDSGILYSHVDTGYIEANHDPAIDIGTHYGWAMKTTLGTPEVDFYNGAWLGYSSETEGDFAISTTVTDFRLKFTDNANVISLMFTDLVRWQDTGTAIIYFVVPVFTGSLDALLIILGLIMIPASTLYLVKGGKDEMSGNKVYYCLIAFTIGWALFLGGIYG